MPVYKFRSFEEASDALAMDRDDPSLARRLAWMLAMGSSLHPRRRHQAGVRKSRSIEDAQAERERLETSEE